MYQIGAVRLGCLRDALDLAADLMTKEGYPPTTKEDGIVKWRQEEDTDHTCEIFFQGLRGVLGWTGYIVISFCDCKERFAFREISKAFVWELYQRKWIANRAAQTFNLQDIT